MARGCQPVNECTSCGACCASFRVDFSVTETQSAGGSVPDGLWVPVTDHTARLHGTDHYTSPSRFLGEIDPALIHEVRAPARLGYGLPPRFSAAARFIQVDVEAEELSRNRRIDVPVVADAGRFCTRLVEALDDAGFRGAPRPGWLREAIEARIGWLAERAGADTDPIHPLRLGRELMMRLPTDAIVVGDGADVQNWMYGVLRIRQAPGFLDHYPLGGMGIGTPLAVGAAAAARELAGSGKPRRVVLVTGDGSFGFYPAEIHAAARAGLPLMVIVSLPASPCTTIASMFETLLVLV